MNTGITETKKEGKNYFEPNATDSLNEHTNL